MIYYSAKTRGFYDTEINRDIPEGAVEISWDERTGLLAGETDGQLIVPGKDGRPILVDPPPPTVEELTVNALQHRDSLLAAAAIRIAPLQDAVDEGEATDKELSALTAWRQYRIKLNRIQDKEGFPMDVAWPASPEEASQ